MKRIVPVLLLLAACATDKPKDTAADLPTWRLEPIATFNPPGDSGWTRAKAVVADRAGNVYVLDEGGSQIRVFDSSGAFLRTIGRKGAGPAEFAPAYGMGIGWLGDTLMVLDPGNGRVTRLGRDGSWIGSWPMEHISGSALHVHQATPEKAYALGGRVQGGTRQTVLIGYTSAGPVDTIAEPHVSKEPPSGIECFAGNSIFGFGIPFAARRIWTADPGGRLATAWTGSYRVAIVGAQGDTARVVQRELPSVAVSDSEWTAGSDEYHTFQQKHPTANCTPADPTRTRSKPALRGFLFDDAGNLWVERTMPSGFALDAFDSTGRSLGTMPAPAHDDEIPLSIRGGRIYAIVTNDSSGVQTVRSYRIVGAEPS